MEMYAGQSDSTGERTYIKTVRSEPTSTGAGFVFAVQAADLGECTSTEQEEEEQEEEEQEEEEEEEQGREAGRTGGGM